MLVFLVAVLENITTVSNLRIFFNAIIFNHLLKPLLLFFVSVHSILIYNKHNSVLGCYCSQLHRSSSFKALSFKHSISKIK